MTSSTHTILLCTKCKHQLAREIARTFLATDGSPRSKTGTAMCFQNVETAPGEDKVEEIQHCRLPQWEVCLEQRVRQPIHADSGIDTMGQSTPQLGRRQMHQTNQGPLDGTRCSGTAWKLRQRAPHQMTGHNVFRQRWNADADL